MSNLKKLKNLIDYLEEEDVKIVKEKEAIYRAIFDASIDCIVVIDDKGKIIDLNNSAEDLFKYNKKEIMNKDVSILIADENHRKNHHKYIEKYRSTGKATIIGLERPEKGIDKDGKIFPIVLCVTEVNLPDKRLFVGVIKDLAGWESKLKKENEIK